MDNKTFGIGILSLMAIVLFVANFMPVRPAVAADSIKDRDYQLVTGRTQQGGEALYVTDTRSGQMAVFTWDTADRTVKLRAVGPVSAAFER